MWAIDRANIVSELMTSTGCVSPGGKGKHMTSKSSITTRRKQKASAKLLPLITPGARLGESAGALRTELGETGAIGANPEVVGENSPLASFRCTSGSSCLRKDYACQIAGSTVG